MQESEIIPFVYQVIQEQLSPTPFQVYLFGSRALKTNNSFSDFDFLINMGKKIPNPQLSQIKESLSRLPTLYSLDISDYHALDPEFLQTIQKDLIEIKNGKLTYA